MTASALRALRAAATSGQPSEKVRYEDWLLSLAGSCELAQLGLEYKWLTYHRPAGESALLKVATGATTVLLEVPLADGRNAPERIDWLLGEGIHPDGGFIDLRESALEALRNAVLSEWRTNRVMEGRGPYENWLVPLIESSAIAQIALRYKSLLRDCPASEAELIRVSSGAMRVLLQVHVPGETQCWLDKVSGSLATGWASGLESPRLTEGQVDSLIEKLEDAIDDEVRGLVVHGEVPVSRGTRRLEDARALRRFDESFGVPFRKYIESVYLRRSKKRFLRDAMPSVLGMAVGQGGAQDDGTPQPEEPVPASSPNLTLLLKTERRNVCFDVAVGVVRFLPARGAYQSMRRTLLAFADEEHRALEAKPPCAERTFLLKTLPTLKAPGCPQTDCSPLCLFQARVWHEMHPPSTPRPDGTPQQCYNPRCGGYDYMDWRHDVLEIRSDCMSESPWPPAPALQAALDAFGPRRNMAHGLRVRADKVCLKNSKARDCRDAIESEWLRERVVHIAARLKAFLALCGGRCARQASEWVQEYPEATDADVQWLCERNPKLAIALGLLLKQGFPAEDARRLLDLVQNPGVVVKNPEEGSGPDALEADIRADVMACKLVLDYPLPRFVAENPGRNFLVAIPPPLSTGGQNVAKDVTIYLEHYRNAAKYWVQACQADADLGDLGYLLGCDDSSRTTQAACGRPDGRRKAQKKGIYRCNSRMQEALQEFLGKLIEYRS